MIATMSRTGLCENCRSLRFSGGVDVESLAMDWHGYERGSPMRLCALCVREMEQDVADAKMRPCAECGTCECNHGTDPVSASHPFTLGTHRASSNTE